MCNQRIFFRGKVPYSLINASVYFLTGAMYFITLPKWWPEVERPQKLCQEQIPLFRMMIKHFRGKQCVPSVCYPSHLYNSNDI